MAPHCDHQREAQDQTLSSTLLSAKAMCSRFVIIRRDTTRWRLTGAVISGARAGEKVLLTNITMTPKVIHFSRHEQLNGAINVQIAG